MNTPAPSAKLAFLTEPSPGVFHLNLRVEGSDFYRIEISRGQLSNFIIDGSRMALHSPNRLLGAYINEDGDAV
jgi:hypothetical protein